MDAGSGDAEYVSPLRIVFVPPLMTLNPSHLILRASPRIATNRLRYDLSRMFGEFTLAHG